MQTRMPNPPIPPSHPCLLSTVYIKAVSNCTFSLIGPAVQCATVDSDRSVFQSPRTMSAHFQEHTRGETKLIVPWLVFKPCCNCTEIPSIWELRSIIYLRWSSSWNGAWQHRSWRTIDMLQGPHFCVWTKVEQNFLQSLKRSLWSRNLIMLSPSLLWISATRENSTQITWDT